MRGRTALAIVGACLAAACGDDGDTHPEPDPLVIPEGCNPLAADADCMLPYPSDIYLTEDGGERRVHIPDAAQLKFEGVTTDILALHRPNGFSVGTPILAVLGAPVDDTPFVFWTDADIDRSLGADSPTILIDAETGEPVLHFAELDPRAVDPLRQGIVLHPLVRLEAGRRYVVALHGIAQPDGSAIAAPAGFASLRDDAGRAHPALEALSSHYEADVFPLVEALDIARGEIQLAWDFTTRTDEDAAGDMLAIRDDMLARLDEAPPEVNVRSVEDDVSEHIARRIDLTIRVPLYVSSIEPGATLNGSPPVAADEVEVPVTVWIPPSVANRAPTDPPARLLQFGHGFFGDRYESDGFPSEFADNHGFVVVAADWWGMASEDRSFVAGEFVTNPGNVLAFTDRAHQAMANFIALAAAAKGPIADLPELEIAEGTPAYDPTRLYFYGISNGHILGGTYLALTPHIERGALGSGGANLSLMLFRARPFLPFLALLQSQVDDPLDHQKFAALAQSIFERVDPVTYAPYVVEKPLAGGPTERRVCVQMGVADSEVPNLGTYFDAKILGAPVLEGASTDFPAWLDVASEPVDGSALTTFDFGFEPTTAALPATESNDVHDDLRHVPASQAQISTFFEDDGMIVNPCEAACDPE